ncbi:nicotinate-nucleotide adenylyltransferase [Anderseniella sp. Alg231-50]|uniref:nicotinate-nucleotide adenylyltransferase n=1 Tax=Anderseniella sp. Alg231-50 TaxID=1922226 RepID=UPI000D560E83
MISGLYSVSAISAQRIGLFGGSFNPAHDGHVAVSEEALKRLQLDQVWWLVSPQNPLKDARDTGDFDDRLALAKSLAANPRLVVTGMEAELGTRTTAQTFNALAPMFRHSRFVWIMGADSFAGLHHWNDWRQIPATLPLAVFARPGWTRKALSSPAARLLAGHRLDAADAGQLADRAAPAWCFLNMPLRPESSTAIRNGNATSGG